MLVKFGADNLKSSTYQDILPPYTSGTHGHKTTLATVKEGKKTVRMPIYLLNNKIFKLLCALLHQVLQQQRPEVKSMAHHLCFFLSYVFLFFCLTIPMLLHCDKENE